MRLAEFTFSIEYIKGSDNIVSDALSGIPWGVLPREPNGAEHVSHADTDSKFQLDAALTILDVAFHTIGELPTLTIEEFVVEQRRNDTLLLIRTRIKIPLTLSPLELEVQPAAIRIYAAMRDNLFLRDNILGLVEDPFTGFRVLVPNSLVDRVHNLGTHE